MAFRNSDTGHLPVSDIYNFIVENFPYYKTAKDGWKNSIRHNLSLNKCFEKIENPLNGSKKGCLWGLNSIKCRKLEEECIKCRQRDLINIRLSMARPDDLNKIERGEVDR
jgi:forkhead box protein N